MILRQLVYLVALAREEHFGRAAEACHVSQPGLSTALKQLEEELQVPIILRSQRFKGFTPQGEIVLSFARKVLADRDIMCQQLRPDSGALSGRLRIGVVPSAMPMLPLLTAPLCMRHPNIFVETVSMTESDIEKNLAAFDLDIGFALLRKIVLPTLRVTRPLYIESYVFLTPKDAPYADRRSISWAETTTVPLCLLKQNIHTRQAINHEFATVGCTPVPQLETDSILGLCAHVGSGQWSTILPKSYLHPFGPPQNTVAIALSGSQNQESVGLAYMEREPLAPLIQAFLDIAAEPHVLEQLRRLNGSPPAHLA